MFKNILRLYYSRASLNKCRLLVNIGNYESELEKQKKIPTAPSVGDIINIRNYDVRETQCMRRLI